MADLTLLTTAASDWVALGLGGSALAAFEIRQRRRQAIRQVHVTMRERWLHMVMALPGHEIIAVQTIRNSLMAATIVASTTVIALMGTISLVAPIALHFALNTGGTAGGTVEPIRLVVGGLVVATLFATFLFATQAARFFNHLGYLVGFGPTASETDRAAAQRYAALAGRYYSDSLRTLAYLAPLIAGLMEPLALPVATVLVIATLYRFDSVAQAHDGCGGHG